LTSDSIQHIFENSVYQFQVNFFLTFSLLTTPNVVLNCDATFKAVPHITEAKQTLTIMAPFAGVVKIIYYIFIIRMVGSGVPKSESCMHRISKIPNCVF